MKSESSREYTETLILAEHCEAAGNGNFKAVGYDVNGKEVCAFFTDSTLYDAYKVYATDAWDVEPEWSPQECFSILSNLLMKAAEKRVIRSVNINRKKQ